MASNSTRLSVGREHGGTIIDDFDPTPVRIQWLDVEVWYPSVSQIERPAC